MKPHTVRGLARRDFLKLASAAGVCGLSPASTAASLLRVCLIVDPENAAASSAPSMKALAQLAQALGAKGLRQEVARTAAASEGADFCIVLANSESHLAKGIARIETSSAAESLSMAPGRIGRVPAILVSANDARGFAYALLDLAERLQYGGDAL